MGSALAMREGTKLVEGTPTDEKALCDELRQLTKQLRVKQRLRGWASALTTLPRRNPQKANWLLLMLDLEANTVTVTGYADRKKATEEVARLETSARREGFDAVLVWVPSVRDLRSAYPNYYADTRIFIRALNAALRGKH